MKLIVQFTLLLVNNAHNDGEGQKVDGRYEL